ncbi:MAG: 4Fe-4S dicluster domain-containing protein [Syntrophomonadaceae bacterium]|nr:4Fe-4S dicluster domain-containing protein [Syntrophomonadaceae bacterium]MDD3890472.1 4Fe-4S dicluster domain-containing protein [Syntrophomonadaceae bacterium]MDD4549915.1 4Fe-4S dicluster domain-containing protein [Syntrophomonadaceae bacterium]
MPELTKKPTEYYFKAVKLNQLDDSLQQEIKLKCGVDVETCMECGKCSGGCSNTHIFDITPRQMIKLIKMGREEPLLSMDSLWTCVSCQLCVDRCPSRIDIPRVMDYLREKACQQGIKPTREQVKLFNELMLGSIMKTGRVEESLLAVKFNLKTGNYFKDADLGRQMFFKGKLKAFGPRVKNLKKIRQIFNDTIQKEG